MTRYATAAELAQLPGFPGSERRAREAAARMGFPSRPRTGRGGGLEYAVEALPPAARMAWAARSKPRFKLHLDGRMSLISRGAK